MRRDYITIEGKQVRIEANWNAMCAFLKASGRDDLEALAGLGNLKPSEIAGLMAACANEGERLDGREANFTAQELSEKCGLATMTDFLAIYAGQVNPQMKAKKKA